VNIGSYNDQHLDGADLSEWYVIRPYASTIWHEAPAEAEVIRLAYPEP
jgi:hypothetical protein